jgi:protein SCO1/2
MFQRFFCCSALLLLFCGCDQKSGPAVSTNSSLAAQKIQVFQVDGVIKELKSDGKTVVIRHQEVPGFMPAMVMPFEARPSGILKEVKAGDAISFRLNVTDDASWIDQITRRESSAGASVIIGGTTNVNGFTFVKDREPLGIGDPIPNYHFTNEQNQVVGLSQFKGQAYAITFIFTRCPLPTFCPRMSTNFKEVQDLLTKNGTDHGTNWHLVSITFDPQFDTPVILKDYSARFGADPAHWTFLTGDFAEISAITDQFGETFWKDQGALNHNLRTAVIDASGKVQHIFEGNNWTGAELAAELKRGMAIQ